MAMGVAFVGVAADWPQFRGPNRDGHWDESGVMESFPKAGLKISWRQPVGGGFSSPVVAEGKAFVMDVEMTKPTSRERVHCYRGKDGQVALGFRIRRTLRRMGVCAGARSRSNGHTNRGAGAHFYGGCQWICALPGH